MFEFFRRHRLLLAPMAGVSDWAFRSLCLEQGADLTYTEMVSAKGLLRANEKTRRLLVCAPNEKHIVVQLFGHDPNILAVQACALEQEMGERLAYIDINMGCPVHKIVAKGDGAALMKNPKLASEVVSKVCAAIEHPVTVKFRRGWSQDVETAPEFARYMEDAGASAVTVHARFAEQMYRGHADWDVIGRVKQAVSIPVVGNGDIFCAADVCAMLERSGCDAVMIARGARGNPWIFAQAQAALDGKSCPPAPDALARCEMARAHAHLLAWQKDTNMVRMRKHAMCYLAGLPKAAATRAQLNGCVTLEDFDRVFDTVEAQMCHAT